MLPLRPVISSRGSVRRTLALRVSPILLSIAMAVVLCATSVAASGPGKIRVAYVVTGARLTAEDDAAIAWLRKDPRFDVRITDVTNGKWVPPICHVLWLHSPGQQQYEQVHALPGVMRMLRTYLSGNGNVVATGYAAFLASDLGFEPVRPAVRFDTLQNDWLWDKKGYHALHGHPLLRNLFGGEYIEDGSVDRILPIVSYDGDVWPAKGKVVAVEKSYVFLRGERKVAVEHRPGHGRLLSLGGMIAFAPVNQLRANLEQFMENALLYTAGTKMPGPVTYWEKMGPAPIREKIFSHPLRRISTGALDSASAGDLLMTRDSGKAEMFGVAGRRALIMGKERGGIDEVWVHPLRILRDYQAGIVSGDSVRWLDNLVPSIEVRPASFTRHYRIGTAMLTETIFPSLHRAGGVARYASTVPVRMVMRFRADLRWMWPFDASALGTLYYGYDNGLNALRVHDRTARFVSMFGADVKPVNILTGQYKRVEWSGGRFSGTPTTDHQVAFGAEYKLGGGMRQSLTFAFAGTNEGEAACVKDYRALAGDPVGIHRALAAHYRALLGRTVGITTPDEEFNTLYKWAIVGADRFVSYTPGVGTGLLAGFATTARGWNGEQKNSGRPGYAWYFGRDAAWSSFAFDGLGDVATVRHQLELYQAFQDRSGKIFHELMTSGVVHFDASDATPMYVMLAAHYMRASGDTAFIRTSWPHLTKAMDFLFSTDTDGDGLIENTDVGHGWVEPGGVLFGTHSEYYLSVLWARALEDAATMAAFMHDTGRSETYQQHAQRVRKSLNSDYWLPASGFFSHGKMQNGTFATERTAFPAVGLMWGMVDEKKAFPLLRAYASSEFSTDWGVRGLSGASRHFNPRGYQEGAAWPLFTGWTALGEFTYGNSVQAFTHIKELMLIKKHWALGSVQEVMHGSVYRPTGVCFQQCWSETNILHPVMEGLVGWKPDAPHAAALLMPRFPINWDDVTVERLRSGATVMKMTMKRVPAYMTYVLERSEGPACTVTLSPEIPPGMRVGRVIRDGEPHFWEAVTERGLLKQPVVVRVDSTVTVSFEYTAGLAMVPVVPRPQPGDSTLAPRILSTSVDEGLYTVEVEGRGGTTAVFPVQFYGFETLRAVGASVRRKGTPGLWECEVHFDPSVHGYVTHTMTLRPE